MREVLIFDREIIEVAWIAVRQIDDLAGTSDRIPRPIEGRKYSLRLKPAAPIEWGSMAVHNILPSELEDCPPSSSFEFPEDQVDYIVGHNIDFDWQAAGEPNVKRICTDAIARWVWPDMDAYSQSALLYALLGPTPETRDQLAGAHSALTDVINNALLLEQILDAKGIETWSALYEFSEVCRIPRVLPFGKWKGYTPEEVLDIDPGYVDWLHRQDWVDPYLLQAFAREDYADPNNLPF